MQHASRRSGFASIDQELRKEVLFLAKCLGYGFKRWVLLLEAEESFFLLAEFDYEIEIIIFVIG